MIYTLEGKLAIKSNSFVVIEIGGIGYRVFVPEHVSEELPAPDEIIKLFCHYHGREDGVALFGFLAERELKLFDMLISISGIGPKSALGILNIAALDNILAAIKEGRAELLTKASGVGRKTAERIILELRGKVQVIESSKIVKAIESDSDIEEALVNLGYQRSQIRDVLKKMDTTVSGLEQRLKAALKILKEDKTAK